jgi:hypothetical protein
MDNTRALTGILQNVIGDDITAGQMRCLLDAVSSLDGMIGGIWEKHSKLSSPAHCGDEYQKGWHDGCAIGITLVTLLWQKRN